MQVLPRTNCRSTVMWEQAARLLSRFLIEDYILHMQHHIDHLLSREVITVLSRGYRRHTLNAVVRLSDKSGTLGIPPNQKNPAVL